MTFWLCLIGFFVAEVIYRCSDFSYYSFANSAQSQLFLISVMLFATTKKGTAHRFVALSLSIFFLYVLVLDILGIGSPEVGFAESVILFATCCIGAYMHWVESW